MRITAILRARVSSLLHNLSAAILVVHLLVGCCAHHAHDCPQTCDARHSEGTEDDAGAPCDGHSHDEQGQTTNHHHGPNECHGVKCSFVRTTNETMAKAFFQPCQAHVTPDFDALFASSGVFADQHLYPAGRLLLPVRLHLANQVLLI